MGVSVWYVMVYDELTQRSNTHLAQYTDVTELKTAQIRLLTPQGSGAHPTPWSRLNPPPTEGPRGITVRPEVRLNPLPPADVRRSSMSTPGLPSLSYSHLAC